MRKPLSTLPALYTALYPLLAERARELGYALAVHGSLARDLDLIAVPWIREAASAEELVEAFLAITGGFIVNEPDADPYDYTKRCPEPKPHGRLAWSIYLGEYPCKPYIDLSVMPKR